jgi:hypothetical protein
MSTRDRLASKPKQVETSIVDIGWHINIIKAMFSNIVACYRRYIWQIYMTSIPYEALNA